MEEILMSIQSKWVEKILCGEKTIEVRKTCPFFDSFKVIMYCTKGNPDLYRFIDAAITDSISTVKLEKNNKLLDIHQNYLNGKIVGEFICNNYERYDIDLTKFTTWGKQEYKISSKDLSEMCLTMDDIVNYANHKSCLYGLHISNLKIYDKPKELKEFNLKRPPQSWCYIKES